MNHEFTANRDMMAATAQAVAEDNAYNKLLDYAQTRANETGRPYLITIFGHCFMDCPSNRKLALNSAIGEGIAETIYPNYSQA